MKNILITGASSGIGAASARMLHAKGYKLGLMARSTDKLNALAQELGDRCLVLSCDVTHYEQVQKILADREIPFQHLKPARYADGLRKHLRSRDPARLVDLLVIGAFIEARSCERFSAR